MLSKMAPSISGRLSDTLYRLAKVPSIPSIKKATESHKKARKTLSFRTACRDKKPAKAPDAVKI